VAEPGVGAPPVPGLQTRPLLLCTCCREPLAPGTDVCPRCNTDVRGGARSQAARSALIFGILGLAFVPIVFSIPAIVMAVRAGPVGYGLVWSGPIRSDPDLGWGRPPAPDGSRGRTLSLHARGDNTVCHGTLQRLLDVGKRSIAPPKDNGRQCPQQAPTLVRW